MIAVIPTRYRPPELDALLAVLDGDGIEVLLLDSADFDHRIYAGWNRGVRLARQMGADTIAILNDDITILSGTLPIMEHVLLSNPVPFGWVAPTWPELAVVYPDINAEWVSPWGLLPTPEVQRTTGTWAGGGMTGYCFLFRSDLALPQFDEGYHWWYGDDAFEQGVRDAGYGVGRVVGVPIRHQPDGSASKRWDELQPLVEEDRARWDAWWQARFKAVTYRKRGE